MKQPRPWIVLLLVLVVALVLVAAWGCHGRVIRKPFVPNHGVDFDFGRPPCTAATEPVSTADDVVIRYLGAGGLLIRWRGTAILTAPFFSNHGAWRAASGKASWDAAAIERGLDGMDLDSVSAVLVGHSHYDHLADLPPILEERARNAAVYVNTSGANMLAAFPPLRDRAVDLNATEGWIGVENENGAVPIRFLPVPSGHADHVGSYHFARGAVTEPWTTWDDKRLRDMKEGQTFAFLIDLLSADGKDVLFRIHYQDAASSAPKGFPPAELIEAHAVDLAFICMPGAWLVENYPRGVLEATRARHALIGHYEDFMRSAEKPVRFVALLRNGRANDFMEDVKTEMQRPEHAPAGPEPCVCGPCGEAWSMPLPGEWMRFETTSLRN